MSASTKTHLRVGYVPEHFSTPLIFASTHNFYTRHNLTVELLPFPSGTGHMITSLSSGALDLAVGLTEGWIAAIANGNKDFKLVGNYVKSPLCWAISTGAGREEELKSVEDLERHRRLGISRVGSGSYVMGWVLAMQRGWLRESGEPWEWKVCGDFKGLRDAVNGGEADAFMWEVFTTKKYYTNSTLRPLGTLYTPWPSWHIVAHTSTLSSNTPAVKEFLSAVNEGVEYFRSHKDEAVEWISTNLDYSAEDAREWMPTCEFAGDVSAVDEGVVGRCIETLRAAGVVKGEMEEGGVEEVVRGMVGAVYVD